MIENMADEMQRISEFLRQKYDTILRAGSGANTQPEAIRDAIRGLRAK